MIVCVFEFAERTNFIQLSPNIRVIVLASVNQQNKMKSEFDRTCSWHAKKRQAYAYKCLMRAHSS